jgi:hypothetical protein
VLDEGEGEVFCCTIAGELFATTDGCGEALALGEGDGEALGEGLGFGVGVGLALAEVPRLLAFRFVDVPRVFVPNDVFAFLVDWRRESGAGGAGPASLRAIWRFADDVAGRVPGIVNTTSSLLPCGSTRAVAPGCKRKETTVLSAARCTLTSEKARPRTASARGTSAGGIFT